MLETVESHDNAAADDHMHQGEYHFAYQSRSFSLMQWSASQVHFATPCGKVD